ncbi:MAG: hypothetical protein V4596_11160 [Bdellovibrionota bacterium]
MIRIILSLLILILSFEALALPSSDKKERVLAELSSLSTEVDVYALQSIRAQITQEELDIVMFRLKKEIEKIPSIDLGTHNTYDLTLIYNLIQTLYYKGAKDYLASLGEIQNLANIKLGVFAIYNELLSYQIESLILRANIDLTKDKIQLVRRIDHLDRLDSLINEYKNSFLPKMNLAESNAYYFEHMATCSYLFR